MHCSRLQQTGRISAVTAGQAEIVFDSLAGCAGCQGKCGIALVVELLSKDRRNRMRLAVESDLATGDRVRVSIAASRLLLLVGLTYLLPIVGLVLGAVMASAWWPAAGDAAALAGALLGAALAVIPALVLRRQQPSPSWLGAQVMREP